MSHAQALIGTSGWDYRHWSGPFYPEGTGQAHQLAFYAGRFETVEVNGTFYRLIAREALARWGDVTPERFVFACKGSRFLTHMKRLKDCGEGLDNYFERVTALGEKLGPIVFQLPAHFRPDRARLKAFLECLPKGHRYAFEFRNPDWFAPAILELLAGANAALCLYEFAGRAAPLELTADFVYIRLHGPDGPYRGSYGDDALETWASRIEEWLRQNRDVFCYFDNDDRGFAPENALRLKAMLA